MINLDNVADCRSMQLISGNGEFNRTAHEQVINRSKFDQCGLSYRVVSIIGPQSSGKSTLLNQLFGTNFVEMNAEDGRSQTTNGVWMAKAVGLKPVTIVMDLEGSDSGERGEDDKAFERQSALFALAVSDVVLINMWCHEIGRDQAANKPLLRTILQVYVTKLVRPGKTTLMFVIRDKSKTPEGKLREQLIDGIQKIWDKDVYKPQEHLRTPLDALFNVQVEALSSGEDKNDQFKREVENLKQRLSDFARQDGRSGDRVSASVFSRSCQKMWKDIRANKDLNIPSHKVLVADKHCEEIACNAYTSFDTNKEWQELTNMEQSGSDLSGFLKKSFAIFSTCLDSYNSETVHCLEPSRSTRREALAKRLEQLIVSSAQSFLVQIRNRFLGMFCETFIQADSGGRDLDSATRSCTELVMNQFRETLAVANTTDFGDALKPLEASLMKELQHDVDKYLEAYSQGRKAIMKTSPSLSHRSLCALVGVVGALAIETAAAAAVIILAPEAAVVTAVYGGASVVAGTAAIAAGIVSSRNKGV